MTIIRLISAFLIFILVFCRADGSPRGHLKSFGHQVRQWVRVQSRYDHVSAEDFYKNHVRVSKPVVIRGGIADWPAIARWPNLTYFSKLTEDKLMTVDWRGIYPNDRHVSRRTMLTDDFIRRMHKERAYMDTPLTPEMTEEIYWPEVLNCEYFIPIMRTGHFFFNNGKSSTSLHIDGCETLFLQISGKRLWLMAPPDDGKFMYAGNRHFPPHASISKANQRSINLTELPEMSKLTIHAAVVNPGDFIYLPEAWFHNVQTRGSPNMATTVFFDSSNCEKLFDSGSVERYTADCDRHRKLLLPKSISCKKKFPPKTTFREIFKQYGAINPNLQLDFDDETHTARQKTWKKLDRSKWGGQKLWDNSRLSRMALNAEIQPVIDSLADESRSILQLRYKLFNLHLNDIEPLARHLLKFKVSRESVQFMIILPHDITGKGADAAGQWLDDAVARFGDYAVGGLDLVLLEAPPCVPATAKDQDCSRNEAMNKERLAVWRMLETWQQTGRIRHLGVKDVSGSELKILKAEAKLPISVVCFRFDPFYRQKRLRLLAMKLKNSTLMAHSVDGSGWTRDGVTAENPLMNEHDFLQYAYSNSFSVPTIAYQMALLKGSLLLPERLNYAPRAEIELEALFMGYQGYFNREVRKMERSMESRWKGSGPGN